jgi:hypothetical protein
MALLRSSRKKKPFGGFVGSSSSGVGLQALLLLLMLLLRAPTR